MNQILLNSSEAIRLLVNQGGAPCVSVILPLQHISPGQHEDWQQMNESIKEAEEMIDLSDSGNAKSLKASLLSISKLVNFNRNDKGLGIYVAEGVKYYVTFPFPVSKSIEVGQEFKLKELMLLNQYAIPYVLLSVSEKRIRLFLGRDALLKEVIDGTFPVVYEPNYEYALPSRSTSYAGSAHVKGFEPDKHLMEKRRFQKFLKGIDQLLTAYLEQGNGLVVCGTKPNTSAFLNISKHKDKLIGCCKGGYDWLDEHEYRELAWPLVKEYADKQLMNVIDSYRGVADDCDCGQGMSDVWNAVDEGRVDTLLVEKDFSISGYTSKDMPNVFQTDLPSGISVPHPDAVNDLLQKAYGKGARVVFVEPHIIPHDLHIAAICRY